MGALLAAVKLRCSGESCELADALAGVLVVDGGDASAGLTEVLVRALMYTGMVACRCPVLSQASHCKTQQRLGSH